MFRLFNQRRDGKRRWLALANSAGLFLVALSLAIGTPARAETPILFGPEFEFRHPRHWADFVRSMMGNFGSLLKREGPVSSRYLEREWKTKTVLIERLKKAHEKWCGSAGCRVEHGSGVHAYKVIYPDGWWFEMKTDFSVIEVTTKPSTADEFRAQKARLDRDLFAFGQRQGLHVSRLGNILGSSHINLDMKTAFRGDPRLLLNFVIDYANHSELATGIHNYDFYNARPVSASPKKLELLHRIRERFERGELLDFNEMALAVHDAVNPREKGRKDYDINIVLGASDMKTPQRLELRAHRPQRDTRSFIDLIDLFEARIHYLAKQEGVIPLTVTEPEMGVQRSLEAYYRYVVESGRDWRTYYALLPRGYRRFEIAPATGRAVERSGLAHYCAAAWLALIRF